MAAKFKEKRQFERIAVKVPLRYQVRGSRELNCAITNDLGIGGIGFINPGFIPPQTALNLEFNLLSRIMNPVGRVARSQQLPHSHRYRIGVEFLELGQQEKQFLTDYVDMQMNRL